MSGFMGDPLQPGLYIVATPIGNLGDITLRALDVLRRCDGVACEDTRITGKLLKHHGVSQPLWRYDDHSGEKDRARLVESMRTRAVALVSDAGTPLVSDPGYRLVADAREAGVPITTLPGACAAIAGLTLSGLPNDRFLFAGFLPAKEKARRESLDELADLDATLVFYETGPRLTKSLAEIAAWDPQRTVCVARELTKLYEEARRGTAQELVDHYAAHPAKGEIVLLIGPPAISETSDADVDGLLRELLDQMSPSKAAAEAARRTGRRKAELYPRAMELKA
jgi:16S rRNA (cytidine1402-2'-O)-methyltransferase